MRHILLNDNLSSQTLTCDFSGLSYSASLGSNNIFLSTDTGCKIIYKTENNKSYIVVSDKNTSTVLFEIGENDSTNTSPFTYDLSSDFGTVITLNTDAYGYTNIHVDESAGNSPVCLKPYETVYSTDEMKTGETWIDSKPIYRKTFIIEAIASGGQVSIDVSSLNIDIFFIDYSKTSYVLTNSFKVSASYSTVENYAQIVDTLLTDNKVFVRCKAGTGQIGIRQGYLTIEYTKTTD